MDPRRPPNKLVYCLAGPYGPEDTKLDLPDRIERSSLLTLNDELHAALYACKDSITRLADEQHGGNSNRRWDECKRSMNDFELVYTPPSPEGPGIAAHTPISRSYFKLWEVLHDYWPEIGGRWQAEPMNAVFLAEGPGGFMEAFANFRAVRGLPLVGQDELHGMTLLQARDRSVPVWRVLPQDRQDARVLLHRGSDGTGNLYRAANIDHLVAHAGGPGGAHVVTADGGFDFSADYNSQEDASMRLVMCEVYAALCLQRLGGAFLLKVYDVHSFATVRLLYVLRGAYQGLRIIKPHSSRPANSEKYVLATSFVGVAPEVLEAMRAACVSCEAWALWQGAAHHGVATRINYALRPVLRVPAAFVRDLVSFNAHYISRQVLHIVRTLEEAHARGSGRPGAEGGGHTGARVMWQLDRAARWCHKYGVKVNVMAMRKQYQRAQRGPTNPLAPPLKNLRD